MLCRQSNNFPPSETNHPASQPTLGSTRLGLLAAMLYGSWAGFVNTEHGLQHALTAALTQAGLSFAITTFLFTLLFWLYQRGKTVWQRWLLAIVGANSITLSTLYLGHYSMGTPDILESLLPSALIGLGATTLVLWRHDRAEPV